MVLAENPLKLLFAFRSGVELVFLSADDTLWTSDMLLVCSLHEGQLVFIAQLIIN